MRALRTCPECGATLPENYSDGRCAACLLRDAIAAAPAPPVRNFGDYQLVSEIARGGMGVVYKARQTSLNRDVAIKMILHGPLATESDVRRFRTEGEAAAHLRHPNIVAIHEIGDHDGQHYFSMDYVDGPNLAELAARGLLDPRRVSGYVKTLAEAIQFAHGKGILHRDLKPSNILINPFDQPQITDFGLAKWMHHDSDLTATGQILGTPNFMPPEQAGSSHGEVGPHSDVYSLGAILYFLLTGAAPFLASTPSETIHHLLNDDPVRPISINPTIPADLQTICLKCLEKNPARRYLSARELAEDLDCFLRDEPIRARPVGTFEKFWRGASRRPLVTTLTVAVLLLSALLIMVLRPGAKPMAAAGSDFADAPPIAPIPVRSGQGVSGVIDGKVYLVTPMDGRPGQAHFLHRYDPKANVWKRLADIPSSRTLAAGAALRGKLYIVGGHGTAIDGMKMLEAYNPASNSWANKTPMPTARVAPATAVLNDRLYVFGGMDNDRQLSTVESYDPATDRWRAEPPLLIARSGCGVGVIGQTFYIVGGFTNQGALATPTGLTEIWRPNGDREIINLDMPMRAPVGHAFVSVLNGYIYVAGGKSAESEVAKLQVYWPEKRMWDSFTAMPEARWGGSGAQMIDGEFWIFGGWTSFSVNAPLPQSDVFVYNPSRNLWRRSVRSSAEEER